ncbi:DNA polymerase III subunit delta [Candidatus Formimonas warabiya]|uniref:DNA polymerase III subunit delta n=1 Tax=Formimonas warabiya TaxID=1761012 RepID=A0A3G1KSH9_FORW1|nr:DNA polymerase III subunit delta [Candidatus Formimonas warabiya]ATW25364.1 DNA polymerase III subunit delta [Candidatus Formimonas warabiya]
MEQLPIFHDIKRGVLSLVYLFYGPETLLIKEALEKLTHFLVAEGIGDFNYEKLDGAVVSPAQVAASANVLPVFAEKRLVVVTGAPWFTTAKGGGEESKDQELDPLLTYLDNPSPSTCLVLVAGEKVDAKRKMVKLIKKVGQVMEFAPLKGQELNRWIEKRFQEKGKKALKPVLDYLAVAGGNNLSTLEHEIEKAALFVGPAGEVTLRDVMQTLGQSSTLSVFNLIDAMSRREASSAVFQLRELVRTGEPEMKVLSLLARQIRILLQIQVLSRKGLGEARMADELGLHPYVVKKGMQQSQNFYPDELVKGLAHLLDADVAIKTGKGEPLALLETAILKMCAKY